MLLNQDFCAFLEYRITETFNYSNDERLKFFWCDGVLLPDSESENSKKIGNDKRQVVMVAFAGQTGQDKYELTLRFGMKALSRYQRNLTLEQCVPGPEEDGWLEVDPEKILEVKRQNEKLLNEE